jgi:hypothetical protein
MYDVFHYFILPIKEAEFMRRGTSDHHQNHASKPSWRQRLVTLPLTFGLPRKDFR